MHKEMIGTTDLYGYWSFVYDISYTEGKNISTLEEFESLILESFGHLFEANFFIENGEIYAYSKSNEHFNSGVSGCKI